MIPPFFHRRRTRSTHVNPLPAGCRTQLWPTCGGFGRPTRIFSLSWFFCSAVHPPESDFHTKGRRVGAGVCLARALRRIAFQRGTALDLPGAVARVWERALDLTAGARQSYDVVKTRRTSLIQGSTAIAPEDAGVDCQACFASMYAHLRYHSFPLEVACRLTSNKVILAWRF